VNNKNKQFHNTLKMEYSYKIIKNTKNREQYIFNITIETFFRLLQSNYTFRNTIINIFVNCDFEHVYWQFPVYSNETKNYKAIFELIKTTPFLKADYRPFYDKFIGKSPGDIVIFNSKSKNTQLISVVPTTSTSVNLTCSDVMNFMKNCIPNLKHNMLQNIGNAMLKVNNSCYLSTHGKGVEWIHIRLCDKPNYYV